MTTNTYLVHHGILGMKWGIRRYQNKDGTLTELGKKRLDRYKNDERVQKFRSNRDALDKRFDERQNARGELERKYGEHILKPQFERHKDELRKMFPNAQNDADLMELGDVATNMFTSRDIYFNSLKSNRELLDKASYRDGEFHKEELMRKENEKLATSIIEDAFGVRLSSLKSVYNKFPNENLAVALEYVMERPINYSIRSTKRK